MVRVDGHWPGTSGGHRPASWWLLQCGEGTFSGTLQWPCFISSMLLVAYLCVYLAETEQGLVSFLQEGAHPGSPCAPGPGAHQESGDFSARLPHAGEPRQCGGPHALCWNWCSNDHQLLLTQKQNSTQHPPPPVLPLPRDPKPATPPCSSANTTSWLLGKGAVFWLASQKLQGKSETEGNKHAKTLTGAPAQQLQPRHSVRPVFSTSFIARRLLCLVQDEPLFRDQEQPKSSLRAVLRLGLHVA